MNVRDEWQKGFHKEFDGISYGTKVKGCLNYWMSLIYDCMSLSWNSCAKVGLGAFFKLS